MKHLFYNIIILLALVACTEEYNAETYIPKLVVEGWIENDGYPVVILTKELPVSSEFMNIDDLGDYILRWAKVTIFDGKDSVVLTGRYDSGYFPPYVYTTSNLKGIAGKTYTLTVEYRDEQVTACTTIPQQPPSCSYTIDKCENSDTLYQITANFTDRPNEKNYYQFFTRVGSQTKQYLASYLGSISDEVIGNDIVEVPVYRAHQLKNEDYTPYFSIGDTVSIKFAQVDEMSFRIWDNYTKTLSLSQNMFLSTFSNLPTNIVGGHGYWCGYGAVTKHFIIQEKTKIH